MPDTDERKQGVPRVERRTASPEIPLSGDVAPQSLYEKRKTPDRVLL
jgi:hypothetical protein